MKGRRIVVQEKYSTKASFNLTKRMPCLEKERVTKAAKEKKATWAIEKTVPFLSFNLNARFDLRLLFFLLAIKTHYITGRDLY